jgi:hypothetical protein
MMEKLVEWMVLAEETEVLGETLPRRHFAHHKSNLPYPGANPGRRSGKPATNHLSYGAATNLYLNRDTMLQAGRLPVRVPDEANFINLPNQPHYGPGVDSACNRNEYQDSSWG